MEFRSLACFCLLFAWTSIAQAEVPTRLIQVSGQITDADGQPIAEAIVTAPRQRRGSFTGETEQAKSDADGKYLFPQLDATYGPVVKVYAPGYAMRAKPVSVAGEGNEKTVDFELARPSSIRVRVVDEAQKPIAGALLARISRNAPTRFWIAVEDWDAFGLPRPHSDQHGWMDIPHQHPSLPVDLTIDHPGFVQCSLKQVSPQKAPPIATMQRGNQVQFQVTCASNSDAVQDARITFLVSGEHDSYRQTITVGKDGKATATLADRRTTIRIVHPTLYGTPWYFYRPGQNRLMKFSLHETGKARGRVIDKASGNGVADLSVSFVREHREIETVRTDADGRYEAELPDQDFEVSVSRSAQWITDGTKLAIKIESGTTQQLDDLFVSSKPPIKGRVITADGEPVEHAIIVASFRDKTLLTDKEGRFSFQTRDQRETFVQALHPYKRLSNAVPAIPGGQDLEIVLDTEGSMVGLVTDDAGKPLAGIPVGLSTQFSFGGGAYSTNYHHTTSRANGTYRFLGLTPGMTYQAQVKGKERASYSSGQVERGNEKEPRARSDRKPLKLHPELLKEVRDLIAGSQESSPKKLLPLNCQMWIGSEPLTMDYFKDKPVVLCFGMSPRILNICEVAHKLYADRGLRVVAITHGPVPIPKPLMEESVKRLGITFPLGVDDGTTIKAYPRRFSSEVFLFEADGRFHSKLTYGEIHSLRRYMLYDLVTSAQH